MPSLGTGTFNIVNFILTHLIAGGVSRWTNHAGTIILDDTGLPAGAGYTFPSDRFTADTTGSAGSFGWNLDMVPGHTIVQMTGFEGGTYFVEAVPAGFQPTTSLFVGNPSTPNLGSGDSVTTSFAGTTHTLSGPASSNPAFALPNNTSFVAMLTSLYMVSGSMTNITPRTPGFDTDNAIIVTGNYEIDAWWWTIGTDTTGAPPSGGPKDPCGNTVTPQLQTTNSPTTPPTSPVGPWKLLDPGNPFTAQPTVIVTAVEPNHGPTVGGTAITITGSGFGANATVAVGGVAATSVVVVSAIKITCVTPAEPPGTVGVVVTNVDGTHN